MEEKELIEKNIKIDSEKVKPKKISTSKKKTGTSKKGNSKKSKANAARKRNSKTRRANSGRKEIANKIKKETLKKTKAKQDVVKEQEKVYEQKKERGTGFSTAVGSLNNDNVSQSNQDVKSDILPTEYPRQESVVEPKEDKEGEELYPKIDVSEIKVDQTEELPREVDLTATQLMPKELVVEPQIKPQKKKTNKKQIIIRVILTLNIIVCLCLLGYSGYNIYIWYQDGQKTIKQVEMIEEKVEIEEKEDSEQTEIIEPEEEIPETDPYWDYIKIPLMNVNFEELKTTNSDVKGWLQVNGTNINYPFVQTSNNDYYLTHSFDKSYNDAGWVFLDYRNDLTQTQKNTILYAHGRWEGTMFGSLRNILRSNWYQNENNHIIRLSTETENTLWQVFSVYQIQVTSDYIQTDFVDDESFLELLTKLKERSYYDFGVTLSGSDSIITLSTCNQDDERIVMHAKLIKREVK